MWKLLSNRRAGRGMQERRKGAVQKRQEVMHKVRRKQEMKE